MPRGTQLSTIRTMLKAEIGASLDATATGKDAAYNQLLSNKQQWLASEYDWPFLEHRWDVNTQIGVRYYALPTVESSGDIGSSVAINFERPVKTEVFFASKWDEVVYGIGSEEFNYIDSDLNAQQLDPVMRWRLATDINEQAQPNQFEMWPMPASTYPFRFTGQRTLQALSGDSDTADLDDLLLVYFVAAELLARSDQQDSQLKMTMAQERMRQVRSSYPRRDRIVTIGGRLVKEEKKRLAPLIAVHG